MEGVKKSINIISVFGSEDEITHFYRITALKAIHY